jgi:hypothetical protein
MAVSVSSSSTGSAGSVVSGVSVVFPGVVEVEGVCEELPGFALPEQLIPERDNTNESIINKKKCFNFISPPQAG